MSLDEMETVGKVTFDVLFFLTWKMFRLKSCDTLGGVSPQVLLYFLVTQLWVHGGVEAVAFHSNSP